jgi:hypothetical protein
MLVIPLRLSAVRARWILCKRQTALRRISFESRRVSGARRVRRLTGPLANSLLRLQCSYLPSEAFVPLAELHNREAVASRAGGDEQRFINTKISKNGGASSPMNISLHGRRRRDRPEEPQETTEKRQPASSTESKELFLAPKGNVSGAAKKHREKGKGTKKRPPKRSQRGGGSASSQSTVEELDRVLLTEGGGIPRSLTPIYQIAELY